MEQHLRAFARDLIQREKGPVSTATITAVFTNLGNPVPGTHSVEHRASVCACLKDDPGLAHDEKTDTFSIRPPEASAE